MQYCRKASELKPISDLEFFRQLEDVTSPLDLDELVLSIRNGNLIDYISKQTLSTGKRINETEWWWYLDRINDIKDYLKLEGYIRNDMDYIVMPERYFAEMYAIPCKLVDKKTCQPYFFSNEEYETYGFGYDRLRLIMNILWEELTPQQFNAVSNDVMNADRYCFDGNPAELDSARRFMRENRKRLGQRFKVCWWT